MMELFDAHGVSFVSGTQQFNTTTSMGRLTLNVLLSFAQFEREVNSERIRDKIAASKRKGLWVGGTLPLGYHMKTTRSLSLRTRLNASGSSIAAISNSGASMLWCVISGSGISEPNQGCSRRVLPGATFTSAEARCSICCATVFISVRAITR